MADSATGNTPDRLVLDGVPKVRYMKDGMCPFALCLKSCVAHLGADVSYTAILGMSGACFRMNWNHTDWDQGNMDLGRLGPEPFRRGLHAVGLKHRFLLEKSWWPAPNHHSAYQCLSLAPRHGINGVAIRNQRL